MKKSKPEKIMTALTEYSKRRNVVAESTANGVLSSDEQSCALSLVCLSSPNTFTFSTTSCQHSQIDHQYIRLKLWIMEASEPCRSELSQILFPTFVHLYLEMVTGCGRPVANKFFKKHYQVFTVNRDYESVLSQIITATAAGGDLNMAPVIDNLRSGKYIIRLSEGTINYFLRYLKSGENTSLLQILTNYVEVEAESPWQATMAPQNQHGGTTDQASVALSGSTEHSGRLWDQLGFGNSAKRTVMDHSPEEMLRLKETIGRIRSLPPVGPSVCLYTVANAYNGLGCACVSQDGTLLACGFEDSVVKLWRLTPAPFHVIETTKETETLLTCDVLRAYEDVDVKVSDVEGVEKTRKPRGGGEMATLRGHCGPVSDVAFCHMGSHAISVSEDTTMRLWDLATGGSNLAVYRGHNYPVWCVAVAPLSLYLATGSYDTTARLWATDCVHPLRSFVGHLASVDCVAFHPNGSYIATGSADKSVRLWQLTDGSVARILLQHKAPVTVVAFSPNARYLASGSEDGNMLIWDLAAGRILCEWKESNTNVNVASLCWSADSSLVISATADGCIRSSHFHQLLQSDGTSSWQLREVDKLSCITNRTGNAVRTGSHFINMTLTTSNYLAVVSMLDVERRSPPPQGDYISCSLQQYISDKDLL